MEEVSLNPALVGSLLWLIMTMLAKSIGKRVTPDNSKAGDLLLQVVTLAFAWQISISLTQVPVIKFMSDAIRGGSQAALQATNWGIFTGLVIGLIFLGLGLWQAKIFSELESSAMATAWRPLVLFTVFMTAASATMPVVNEVANWLGQNIAVPAGRGMAAGINYVANLPQT